MKILMLGRWVPPPRSPLKGTREYELSRALARAHQLTLAFVTDNPDASGAISALRDEFGDLEFAKVPRGWKSLAGAISLTTGESCTLSYFRSEALTRRLSDRVRSDKFDLIYVSSAGMISYALQLDPKIDVVVDFGSIDSEWWLHQASTRSFASSRFFRTEAARLRAAETAIARRASRAVVASAEAADVVRSFAPTLPVTVIPDGVIPDPGGRGPGVGDALTVVVSGGLAQAGDIQDVLRFCREVAPRVTEAMPAARFVVFTRETWPAAADLRRTTNVELVSGQADVRPVFRRAAVAVAPQWTGSADLRVGVLEPMAAGMPVVATARAGKGLDVGSGGLWIADDSEGLAKRIVELLGSESERREAGAAARRFVEGAYSWEAMGEKLRSLVAIRGAAPGAGAKVERPREITSPLEA